jgi:hypothetical protein
MSGAALVAGTARRLRRNCNNLTFLRRELQNVLASQLFAGMSIQPLLVIGMSATSTVVVASRKK